MADNRPPSTRLEVLPGENLADAMLRELARNPESPASLRIRSAVGELVAPWRQAVCQLLEALEAQLRCDGERQRAAVDAAIGAWERACSTKMENQLLETLREEAKSRIDRDLRGPPAMEGILGSMPKTTDTGYEYGIHLYGLQGTWHRLWAMVCLAHGFGDSVEGDENVAALRGQFEQLLGRSLEKDEWSALVEHAVRHTESRQMQPPPQGEPDR